MRRLFWVALGATAGILLVRKLGKAAEAYSPGGIASSFGEGLSDLGQALREMAEVVREGMAERESELRYALGIDTGTAEQRPAEPMTGAQARALLDDPTGPRGS